MRRVSVALLTVGAGLCSLRPPSSEAREAVEGEWTGEVRNATKILARVRMTLRVVDGRLAGELVVPKEWNRDRYESVTYRVQDSSRAQDEWRVALLGPHPGARLFVVLRTSGGGLSGPLGGWAEDQATVLVLRPGLPDLARTGRFAGTWAGTHRTTGPAGTVVRVLRCDLRVAGDGLDGVVRMDDPAVGECPASTASVPVGETQVLEENRIRIRLSSPSREFVGFDLARASADGPLQGTATEGVFLERGEPRILFAGAVRLARGGAEGLVSSFEPPKPLPAPGKPGEVTKERAEPDAAIEPYVGRWEGRLTVGPEPTDVPVPVTITLARQDGGLRGELNVDATAPAPWGGRRLELRSPRLRGDTLFLEGREAKASGPEGLSHPVALVLGRQEDKPAIVGCVGGWPRACRDHGIRVRRAE